MFVQVRAAIKVKASVIIVFTSSGRAARYFYKWIHIADRSSLLKERSSYTSQIQTL